MSERRLDTSPSRARGSIFPLVTRIDGGGELSLVFLNVSSSSSTFMSSSSSPFLTISSCGGLARAVTRSIWHHYTIKLHTAGTRLKFFSPHIFLPREYRASGVRQPTRDLRDTVFLLMTSKAIGKLSDERDIPNARTNLCKRVMCEK